MEELHQVLRKHSPNKDEIPMGSHKAPPSESSIPDLFFDRVLVDYKLSRTDITILLHLYRMVWCKPNIYKTYGFTALFSVEKLAEGINITCIEFYNSVQKLEELGFLETIRSGQYFVRRYFTESYDHEYGQMYDNF